MNTEMTYEVVDSAESFEKLLARVREAQKKDSVSAAKDCSLFMEQEYVFRAKTFFDFSSR